jgi:hypothetical protein
MDWLLKKMEQQKAPPSRLRRASNEAGWLGLILTLLGGGSLGGLVVFLATAVPKHSEGSGADAAHPSDAPFKN